MSIMICNECGNFVDTDHHEMFETIDNTFVCFDCADDLGIDVEAL